MKRNTQETKQILTRLRTELNDDELIELSYDHVDLSKTDANKVKVLFRNDTVDGDLIHIIWMSNLHNYYELIAGIKHKDNSIEVVKVDRIDIGECLSSLITTLNAEELDNLAKLMRRITCRDTPPHSFTTIYHEDPKYNVG